LPPILTRGWGGSLWGSGAVRPAPLGNDAGVANDVMDNGDDPGPSRAQPGSSLAPLSNT